MVQQTESATIVVVGSTGKVGRLLVSAFDLLSLPGLKPLFQTRKRGIGRGTQFLWQPLLGPQALAGAGDEFGPIDCVFDFSGTRDQDVDHGTKLALAVLKGATQAGVRRIFYASSAAVYGRPDGAAPLPETILCKPISNYGRAKLALERAVRKAANKSGCNATVMRIGNVAGADQVLRTAAHATTQSPMLLDRFADGASPLRSYVGPQTLAKILTSLSHATIEGRPLPEILNVASPEPVFMHDLLLAAKNAEMAAPWHFRNALPGAIPAVVLDTARLNALHRFEANDSQPQEIVRQWADCRKMT